MRMEILAARTPAWAAVVTQASQLINGSGFRPLKRSMRTVAGFIVVDGTEVFIKCVDEGGWLKGWIRRMSGSRARRVLRGAAILKAGGFARPEPLAAAEARSMGAVQASYVISEVLGGARVGDLTCGQRRERQQASTDPHHGCAPDKIAAAKGAAKQLCGEPNPIRA